MLANTLGGPEGLPVLFALPSPSFPSATRPRAALPDLTEGLGYTLAMRSEKATVALGVVKAIVAHDLVSVHDAFQVRFWVSPEEALLPLDEIARLILHRESNSNTAQLAS
jgi:hypothetical protein